MRRFCGEVISRILRIFTVEWWGMGSFNAVKYLAVGLIFGGVYLVTTSKSRRDLIRDKTADNNV